MGPYHLGGNIPAENASGKLGINKKGTKISAAKARPMLGELPADFSGWKWLFKKSPKAIRQSNSVGKTMRLQNVKYLSVDLSVDAMH
jgi:hypothetical protein